MSLAYTEKSTSREVNLSAPLAAQLRTSKVPLSEISMAIDASDLNNPFTATPFVWDEDSQAIVFVGLEPEDRGTHLIYY
jgi:hypothetical protein